MRFVAWISRATARVPQLSPREREIMHLMAEGHTAEQIGDQITVSVETVRTHVRNVLGKVHLHTRRSRQLADLL